MQNQEISSEFPFESHFVEVHGSKIHYIDQGKGDPVLFLHGNPTSSYLWRNVIPYVSPAARAIAPDLIGMGSSDKPDIAYRFFDHSRYVDGFIEALGLDNITLVLHDWGSALGFHYARRHEGNIKGLAFTEAILRPSRWSEFPSGFKFLFKSFRTPGVGWLLIVALNMFVRNMIPSTVVRKLSGEELARYREPYPTLASRKPLLQWPREIPIDGHPVDVHEAVEAYSEWLQESEIPKILFYATPGAIIPARGVESAQKSMKNLQTVDIGNGIHYVQEDNPHRIGSELAKWYASL